MIPETGCDRIVFGAYEFTDAMTEAEWEQARKGQLVTNTSWYDAVVWRSLLRREFLQQHNLYFRYPELTHGEDGLFMYEVTLCCPVSAETEEVLYFYRLHSGSAEAAVSPESIARRLRSLIRVCHILHSYYENEARGSADRFMSFLWMTLYDISRAPGKVEAEALAQLRQLGLFPSHRPDACTLDRSYLFGGLAGKILDPVYLNLHRPWGYRVMRMLQKIRK